MANFWDDYTGGSLMESLTGLATTALPALLDKPGATGTTSQAAPAVPPAPVGATTGAPALSAVGWFEQNKMMVIGGGVVVVLVLVLVMGRK